MLGPPDGRAPAFWVYSLGAEQSPFQLDDDVISIEFAPSGRVVAAEIATT